MKQCHRDSSFEGEKSITAKLRRRIDGCFITIGHGADSFHTLQLWGKRVLFLKQHGVNAGDRIPEDLLSDLWKNKWVYVEGATAAKIFAAGRYIT